MNGSDMGLSLAATRRVIANHKSYDIYKRPVVVWDLQHTNLISSQSPIDRENSHTWIIPLTTWENEWLVSIRPLDLVFYREWLIDIQPYVSERFSRQFGYSQEALGYPSRIRGIIKSATLQDALHARLFFSTFNTGASFQLPQYEVLVYTFSFAEWYSISRTSIHSTLKDGLL